MSKTNLYVNKIIRGLITADFALIFSYGLFAPIFAVFVLEWIEGSRLEIAGLAVALYWVARVLTTIPISRFMDVSKGDRDEYYFLLFGTIVWVIVPLFFLVASTPIHIYIIQIILGVAGSMRVQAWRILFTRHLDKGEVGYEWSLEDVGIGIATAASAYIGAFLADRFGFTYVILLVSAAYFVSVILIVRLYPYMLSSKKEAFSKSKLRKKKHIRLRVKGI